LFFSLPVILTAGGKKEEKDTPMEEEKGVLVQVSGRIRLVGNEPFTSIVITGAEKEWYVDKEDEQKLKALQQKTVTVEAYETVLEFTFPNGLVKGKRLILKNIRIIKIE
jgi:hypothetical protein